MPPKRGPTAYFLFSEEQRAPVREELLAGSESGKVSVAEVAKVIGERWRNLPDEEKQFYKDRAAAAAEEAATAAPAADNDDEAAGGANDAADAAGPLVALPISVVKKVMLLDPEVARVSADGVKLVAKAAEAFLEHLAAKAAAAARVGKRRTVRLDDCAAAVKADKRLGEMGLREVLDDLRKASEAAAAGRAAERAAAAGEPSAATANDADVDAEGEAGEAAGGEAGAGPAKKKQKVGGAGKGAAAKLDEGKRITAFFTKAA